MFKKHFYKFGGKTFHQDGGGPIGPRGTCAVARMIMQIYDRKWGDLLESLRVKTTLLQYVKWNEDFIRIIGNTFEGSENYSN